MHHENSIAGNSSASGSASMNGKPASALVEVVKAPGEFKSKLIALNDLPAGKPIGGFESATRVDKPAYSSVQVGEDQHIELNSELLYVNHSCKPNVEFRIRAGSGERAAVGEVIPCRDIQRGEMLTFFYPSTEWDMVQGFQCTCGEKECLGWIAGAKYLHGAVLRKYWLSRHVESLLEKRGDEPAFHEKVRAKAQKCGCCA